jgi:hypothetical protein
LQTGNRFTGGRQHRPDFTDLRGCSGGRHARQPGAARRHRAGVHTIAVGTGAARHGDRLAGQQRLVDLELALQQDGVGRDPVALVQREQITGNDFASGHAQRPPVADHQRARRR